MPTTSEEVIGRLVGHAPGTQAGPYGGGFPIKILAEAIQKIDYGFDVVAMLRSDEAALGKGRLDRNHKIASDAQVSQDESISAAGR